MSVESEYVCLDKTLEEIKGQNEGENQVFLKVIAPIVPKQP
jgi:hypothetical protein